jgi:hypothetical protein
MKIIEIAKLRNFNADEKTVFGDFVFGKMEDLNRDFVFFHDGFVSQMKRDYGSRNGQCIIHDFNMRQHDGEDHPEGIAVDYHFRGIGLYDTVMGAIAFGYRKIFFYPEWKQPGMHCSYVPGRPGVLLGYGYYVEEKRDGKTVRIQKIVTNTYYPEKVYAKLREADLIKNMTEIEYNKKLDRLFIALESVYERKEGRENRVQKSYDIIKEINVLTGRFLELN